MLRLNQVNPDASISERVYMCGSAPTHTGRGCQRVHVHKEDNNTKPWLAVP